MPVVHKLLKAEDSATVNIDVHAQAEEEEYMSLLKTILTESSAQPQQVLVYLYLLVHSVATSNIYFVWLLILKP